MTKQTMVALILNNPETDRDDRALTRKLSKVRTRNAKTALVNIVLRVSRAA